MATWWDYVQRHLDERGWTPSELSRQANINRSIVGRWRSQDAKPEVTTARAVAKAFGVSLGEVLIASGLAEAEELGVAEGFASTGIRRASDEELMAELKRRMAAYRAMSQEVPEGAGDDAPESSIDRTWSSRVHKDRDHSQRR